MQLPNNLKWLKRMCFRLQSGRPPMSIGRVSRDVVVPHPWTSLEVHSEGSGTLRPRQGLCDVASNFTVSHAAQALILRRQRQGMEQQAMVLSKAQANVMM